MTLNLLLPIVTSRSCTGFSMFGRENLESYSLLTQCILCLVLEHPGTIIQINLPSGNPCQTSMCIVRLPCVARTLKSYIFPHRMRMNPFTCKFEHICRGKEGKVKRNLTARILNCTRLKKKVILLAATLFN